MEGMNNLLEETITALVNNGKRPSDVLKVGTRCFDDFGYSSFTRSWTWEEFVNIVKKVWYHRIPGCFDKIDDYFDFEHTAINTDLVIIGNNWWLSRFCPNDGEYYREGWKYNTLDSNSSLTPMNKEDVLGKVNSVDEYNFMIRNMIILDGPEWKGSNIISQ